MKGEAREERGGEGVIRDTSEHGTERKPREKQGEGKSEGRGSI